LVITLDREHPAHNFIPNLEKNLRTYGSFSIKIQQRRRGNVLGKEGEEQLLAYVRVNPRVSTRHVSIELGIYKNQRKIRIQIAELYAKILSVLR
jgi:hypothetical protein